MVDVSDWKNRKIVPKSWPAYMAIARDGRFVSGERDRSLLIATLLVIAFLSMIGFWASSVHAQTMSCMTLPLAGGGSWTNCETTNVPPVQVIQQPSPYRAPSYEPVKPCYFVGPKLVCP